MPLDEPIALTPGLVLMGSIVVVALVALAAWWVLR
jgi:preprotein translocase subunit Sec61beta